MAKVTFGEEDFRKELGQDILSQGDVEKNDLQTLRVDLEWFGTDLDVCAFLLDSDGELASKESVVYFKSKTRWKPKLPFNHDDFNPLDGEISIWEKVEKDYCGRVKYWMRDTLPLSPDGSVIGSWDDMTDDEDAQCGETMHILIDEVNTMKYKEIVFAAVVADEKIKIGERFKDVEGAKVTITDVENEEEIVSYTLSQKFPNNDAVCFGKLVYDKDNYKWSYKPMSVGYNGGILYLANEVF